MHIGQHRVKGRHGIRTYRYQLSRITLDDVADYYRAPGWFTRNFFNNLLVHDGHRYLVSPRGETQWVRNLRAAGTGELRLGRHTESFRGRELGDDEKITVLRAYLRKWWVETGIFLGGTGPTASDDKLRAIAPRHPAFELLPVSATPESA